MRASDLPNLVDDHGLHAAPSRFDRAILLRLVPDPWPFADLAVEPPRLVQAPDLPELALEGQSHISVRGPPLGGTRRGIGPPSACCLLCDFARFCPPDGQAELKLRSGRTHGYAARALFFSPFRGRNSRIGLPIIGLPPTCCTK